MATQVMEKLYPPTIKGSIPAFYLDETEGTATIAVPFLMNKAVSVEDVAYFSLKVKTVQTNTFLFSLTSDPGSTQTYISEKVVKFTINNKPKEGEENKLQKIKLGQYLKIQLAYNGIDDAVGYYSTVGIIKYTSKPSLYIKELSSSGISIFYPIYTGIFQSGEDKSERPYSYCFTLYDNNQQVIEKSDWLLHNSTILIDSIDSQSVEQTLDTYSFDFVPKSNVKYYVQYGVRTLNDLEIFSQMYPCMETAIVKPSFKGTLVAENIFDEGYINLSFEVNNINETIPDGLLLEIARADNNGNYENWRVLKRVYFNNYLSASTWNFQDFTIEQGVYYKYSFREYNNTNNYSTRMITDVIYADFEDMFLWDGYRQLKIRFNPKVSSFKTTIQESKTDTIGSKYPFFFKNGVVGYKEFPISGLLSYLIDKNKTFIKPTDNFQIVFDAFIRQKTPGIDNRDFFSETTNLVNYNFCEERKFKLRILDWLNNGEIKLFRSPAEGNYLVRLMNISLSPEDKLSRLIHTFSSTAYEIQDFNYQNLINLGFIQINEPEEIKEYFKSINLGDFSESIKEINNIYEYIKIEVPSIPGKDGYYFRFYDNSENYKVYVRPGANLTINLKDTTIPVIYYYDSDNDGFSGDGIIITYKYKEAIVITDQLGTSQDALQLVTQVKTFFGPTEIDIYEDGSNIDKIFNIKFEPKEISSIYECRPIALAQKNDGGLQYYDDNLRLVDCEEDSNKIILTYKTDNDEEEESVFTSSPILNINTNNLIKIKIGSQYFLNLAYQIHTEGGQS